LENADFIGGLKADRVIAPWVLDHAINGTSSMVWLMKRLMPGLSLATLLSWAA
jgi:hypothetical protein